MDGGNHEKEEAVSNGCCLTVKRFWFETAHLRFDMSVYQSVRLFQTAHLRFGMSVCLSVSLFQTAHLRFGMSLCLSSGNNCITAARNAVALDM